MQPLDLRARSATDPGIDRLENEDALASRESSTPVERVSRGAVWVIADGLGAQGRGARAAQTAAAAIVDGYWASAMPDPADRLRDAVERTNALLFAENEPDTPSHERSGATSLAAAIIDSRLHIAHVGRSRAYLLRAGMLRRLTSDHTWVAEQVRAGLLDPADSATHPRRNMITRCLGIRPKVAVDIRVEALQSGDVVLLCSDGLHRYVDDSRIASILAEVRGEAAPALVSEARDHMARDNITAVTIQAASTRDIGQSAIERLAVLSRVGRELGASLEIRDTLASVLRQVLAFTGGERAVVLLRDLSGKLVPHAAHNITGDTETGGYSTTIAMRAVNERKALLIGDAFADAQAGSVTSSVIAQLIRSVLCVPLIVGDEAVGALYVDAPARADVFDSDDLDLLVAFAGHAATAIENARLHAQLLERTRELEQARRRQEALVRSLSSALIAIDLDGRITTWNPAAEEMLGVTAATAVGRRPSEVLPATIANWLSNLVVEAELADRTILMGNEWEGSVGSRNRVILAGRVTLIREENRVAGFAFILNDRTDFVLIEEARRRESAEQERQRALFSRYLAPSVVERALKAPDSVQLGGARQPVTVLFADVRGFTGYTEQHPPEDVVELLNQYLALATSEIFNQYGTLDKFIGDGVMAIFGAPLALPQHALAAVRAALAMRAHMDTLRRESGARFGFGIGINSGETVVGNIGTAQLMNYTAIGDVVNVANRLESEARAGEILISQATLEAVGDAIEVEELGPIYVKGRAIPVVTYKVLGERLIPAMSPGTVA